MSENDERFCVVSDGDGHSWLCPAERRTEALALIEACETYWGSSRKGPAPPDPDSVNWLRRIDGIHRLTFTDPQDPS